MPTQNLPRVFIASCSRAPNLMADPHGRCPLLSGLRAPAQPWSDHATGRCRSARLARPGRGSGGRRRRVLMPPPPITATSGNSRVTAATQRSAIGPIAGPVSPPGRPSGMAAGTALPMTTAAGAGVDDAAGALDDARQVGPELGEHRQVAGELPPDGGDDAGRVVGLAHVEEVLAHLVGGADVDLEPGDARRATEATGQVGVLPHRRAGDRDVDPDTGPHQPRQLGGQEVLEAGVLQTDRVDEAARRLDDPGRRAARRAGRG